MGFVSCCRKDYRELEYGPGGYDSRSHSRSHRDYLAMKKLYDQSGELVFDLEGTCRETESIGGGVGGGNTSLHHQISVLWRPY